jgi:hypothetical protein
VTQQIATGSRQLLCITTPAFFGPTAITRALRVSLWNPPKFFGCRSPRSNGAAPGCGLDRQHRQRRPFQRSTLAKLDHIAADAADAISPKAISFGNQRDNAASGVALATENYFDSDRSQEWL